MSEDKEYLAFIDYIGTTIEGYHRYRFDFTQAPEIVWGEDWNSTPAGIIPNIQPDINCLSTSGEVICNSRFNLAKENTCFSMQDCIDGIIPLLFSDIKDKDTIVLPFGMTKEDIEEALSRFNLKIENRKKVSEERDDAVINTLMEKLEGQTENGGDEDE